MLNRPDNQFSAPVVQQQHNGMQHYSPNQQNYFGVPPQQPEADGENRFDIIRLFWYVIRHRWLIGSIILCGLLGALAFTEMQTPKYRAGLTMELLGNNSKVFQEFEVTQQSRVQQFLAMETALRKIKSRNLARRVVHKLNLTEKPDFFLVRKNFSPMNIVNKALGRTGVASAGNMSAQVRERLAINRVRAGLSANLVRKTSIVNIQYVHPVKKYVDQVANAVAEAFIEQSVDVGTQASSEAKQFLEEQVESTKIKLQDSERTLNEYAKEQGISTTDGGTSLVAENIKAINTALAESVQERLESERLVAQIDAGNAQSLPAVIDNDAIAVTKTKIAELRATYQEKLSTLKPGFPEMRRLQAQINELRGQLTGEIGVIANSIKIKFDQSKRKEADLRQELSRLEEEQIAFQDKNIQYTILKREVDSNRTQYDALIKKLNQIDVGADIKAVNASVVDPALPPGGPFSPSRIFNMLVAFAMSLGVAGAVVYILELLNNTFSTPDQVESELQLPILGIVPDIAEDEIERELANERSAISEAYRTLRTSIQFTGTDGYVKSLMVTSSEPSEGKSTTVSKLAKDFASLGMEVLVIDGDMRKPKLHRNFGKENDIGLSNLLTNVVNRGSVLGIFQKTAVPGVTFLSAGTIPPNPADLLASAKMSKIIELCGKKYDMVIIDAPPVMGISDAPILSRQTEAVVFVVASKQVTRKSATNAIKRLAAAGANVIGVAMTKFSLDRVDYNYAYRYMEYDYFTYSEQPALAASNSHARAGNNSGRANEGGPVSALLGSFRRSSS